MTPEELKQFDEEFTQYNLRDDLSEQKVARYIKEWISSLIATRERIWREEFEKIIIKASEESVICECEDQKHVRQMAWWSIANKHVTKHILALIQDKKQK